MGKLALILLLLGSSACIYSTPNHGRPVVVKERGCGPAHHWNGRECVHNGHGHGGHDD